ncbi:hypothetical protein ILUMI_05133 [Ignelater luminosus]|uniref:Uncharacterized protein n=1 Tax=Ignelater luminosus TaxID=2038154 RepID=A0A8K0GGP1_IGNLU|nr:hypothetical protein ILUMI_05133 [Ignelater luminosus]
MVFVAPTQVAIVPHVKESMPKKLNKNSKKSYLLHYLILYWIHGHGAPNLKLPVRHFLPLDFINV